MKSLLIYGTLFFILSSFSITEDLVTGLKKGNASQVSKYFDNTVEITFPDKTSSYSKSQATLVLQDFFNTNAVKNLQVLHQGDNATSQYCIGILQTKNGEFRTSLYLKLKGDLAVLQEIKFEK